MNMNVDVRIGKVTDVNKEKRLVRVKFEDTGITSGWLPVMQHYKAIVVTGADNSTNHQHKSHVVWWVPAIDDIVICLYLPCFNADGFVLGGIYP